VDEARLTSFARAFNAEQAEARFCRAAKGAVPDFLWQNRATTGWAEFRRRAGVYNHLSGSEIFEDKAKLALLLRRSALEENRLESRVFATAAAFAGWCRATCAEWNGAWIAKDPRGNSGVGLWMLGAHNWERVATEVAQAVGGGQGGFAVVVQRYMPNPMCWRKRKLQFRLYGVVTGDLSVWLYRHGMPAHLNIWCRGGSALGQSDRSIRERVGL